MSDFTASNIPPYPSALSFLYKVYDGGITSESYIPGFNHVSVPMIISGDITSSEYRKSKNIEFIAAKIQLSKQKPLIIGSYYRPPK
jgi:hypothetical protein